MVVGGAFVVVTASADILGFSKTDDGAAVQRTYAEIT